MLFNSYEFIFLFLPITFGVYFYLNRKKYLIVGGNWLVLSSLFYYSYWNLKYLPLILLSIFFNFIIGSSLTREDKPEKIRKKGLLLFGLIFNLSLLGFFKYADFFIANINYLLDFNFPLISLTLPLAISFFTFQQITYLVDSYKGETREYDFLNYTLFVTFFPQLIAGPIVHHKEMMPQFSITRNKLIDYENVTTGIFIFSIGLFKKVIIADSLSIYVVKGFENAELLNFMEAWITSLSYTFQLYFDFSGYTDMAVGAALLMNIKLPINFNSPYKAVNIRDFWRRWHITLGRFLRDYVYIPLGGNKNGRFGNVNTLMVTFLLGGLWHGAGWTFVFWGALHGVAMAIHRIWNIFDVRLNRFVAWFITFNFINISWVFFRALEWKDAISIIKSMFDLTNVVVPPQWRELASSIDFFEFKFGNPLIHLQAGPVILLALLLLAIITLGAQNSIEMKNAFKPDWKSGLLLATSFSIAIVYVFRKTEFLYYQF